jgi:drug/metabolite transporter (DMT)-like permease
MPWLAAVVLSGGILGPLMLMAGLAVTSASSASLLLNLEGLFTLGIAWVVFRENVDVRVGIGATAILLGALVLSWQDGMGGFGLGALAIAAACLCWAIDNNLTRKLSSADPLQIAMIKGLVAGVVNVALAASLSEAVPAASLLTAAAVVGFFGYGISLTCFVLALRHLGSARTAAYFSMAPFIGALLSIVLFHEPMTFQLIAAVTLMGVGLYLHLVERHEHEHSHEELAHEHAHVHDEHHQHSHAPNDPTGEPHVHAHRHAPMVHAHAHYPDIHHRHRH